MLISPCGTVQPSLKVPASCNVITSSSNLDSLPSFLPLQISPSSDFPIGKMAFQINYLAFAASAVAVFILYSLVLVIYRLYFHPLTKFPGPKMAAATLWYEFYYDVNKRGSYIWKIRELHEEYGTRPLPPYPSSSPQNEMAEC